MMKQDKFTKRYLPNLILERQASNCGNGKNQRL